jgi:hypothetical protein
MQSACAAALNLRIFSEKKFPFWFGLAGSGLAQGGANRRESARIGAN